MSTVSHNGRSTSKDESEAAEEIRRLFERYREMAARNAPRTRKRFTRVTTPQKLRSPVKEPGRFTR